eukprot:7389013-Prymnesium_polylepis.5
MSSSRSPMLMRDSTSLQSMSMSAGCTAACGASTLLVMETMRTVLLSALVVGARVVVGDRAVVEVDGVSAPRWRQTRGLRVGGVASSGGCGLLYSKWSSDVVVDDVVSAGRRCGRRRRARRGARRGADGGVAPGVALERAPCVVVVVERSAAVRLGLVL